MFRRSFLAVASVCANVAVGLPIDRNFSLLSFYFIAISKKIRGLLCLLKLQKIKLKNLKT